MPRPLIIGMCNPVSQHPEHALYPLPRGHAGHRLFLMLREALPSATMSGYARRFERLNLVTGPWDASRARDRADRMRVSLAGRYVVLLGREVAAAFGVVGSSIDEIRCDDGATFYLLPHPSGRNLLYNDFDTRRAAGEVLASLHGA